MWTYLDNTTLLLSVILISILTISRTSVSALECYCEGDGCPAHEFHNNTCVSPANSKCFASVWEIVHDNGDTDIIHSYGCLPTDESTIMQCKGNLVPHRFRLTILCCDDKDFCNDELHPELKPHPSTPHPLHIPKSSGIAITVMAVVVFVVILALVGLGIFIFYRKRKFQRGLLDPAARMETQSLVKPALKFFGSPSKDNNKDSVEQSVNSGSGSGFPLLVQANVARQLQYKRCIGKGRYGEVWHAKFRDEDVAVKIFSTLDDASWLSEKKLYETRMLAHNNILGFKSADIGGAGECTQMLLVTDFHKASLYDHLRELPGPLDFFTMIKLADSIASGLSHLHAAISGTDYKPAIVHRDLKSKNILVKMDGASCVIADFGLAVREDELNEVICDTKKRQGTRRYMAPEILDFSIYKTPSFEAFKQADIYSFSLVLWELARSTQLNDFWEGYQLPYQDCVSSDPSFDEMKFVVCQENQRPDIYPQWLASEATKTFSALMIECWSANPAARLTALRIKKTLAKLGNGNPNLSTIPEMS